MGRDSVSVVDANLKIYGIENLRIADISVMSAESGREIAAKQSPKLVRE
jgi:choline dehydrogenase-like flavoprotein